MTLDLSAELNEEQLAVAQAGDGPLLVLAAAGTGKTRTLVYRVAHLVNSGVDPDRILLLTFTNKAAKEMMVRASGLVNGVSGVMGGTFHHMANRLLRRHGHLLGYGRDFSILDRDDSKTLFKNSIRDFKLNSKEFPKAEVLMGLYSQSANTETLVSDIAEERFEQHEVDISSVCRVVDDYVQRKRSIDGMDFDDLLVNGLKLFREHPDILEYYQQKYLYVLVDEYQDTNVIQAEWVDHISGHHRNLLVVGDDFQSIYSWRGADYRNILTFKERYTDATIYKLETNYRSTPDILAVANACIAGNPEQFQKTLRATREPYKAPRIMRLRDGSHQARFVVDQIRQMRREGYPLKDIAILYRAHYHAMELQLELTRAGIPYGVTSGMRFFEQAHIKDICALMRLIQNPADEVAFCRLMEMLPKVGPRTALKVWHKLGGRYVASDAMSRMQLLESLPAAGRERWTPVHDMLGETIPDVLNEDFGEIMHRFVEVFYDHYSIDRYEDADRRLDDIRELIIFTSNFENLHAFLSEAALMSNMDSEGDTVNEEDMGDAVRLSSAHQAKGLEWPVVMLLWLTDGMFPSSRSLTEGEGDDSEERRLFYVSVTRAMDELIICVPEVRRTRDGGVMVCERSRFVSEIPAALVQERNAPFI